jgi:hypothetical protein
MILLAMREHHPETALARLLTMSVGLRAQRDDLI